VHVRVRLFAILRERAGADEIELQLPEGAHVADALAGLGALSSGVSVVMAVNHEYADLDTPLRPGDELALIPPVSGGAGPSGSAPPADSHGAVTEAHVRITDEGLRLDPLLALVRDPRAGAIVTFLGVTREAELLEYEAYVVMAERQIARIVADAIERHGLCRAAAEHRVGVVPLSEPSVAVAVSAPHRAAAFAGAREIIDRIKDEAPIWKREEGEWMRGVTPGGERRR
jgi:MoaE-MoaD fusion protein